MFEIGDKVRITDKYPVEYDCGKVGEIVGIYLDTPYPYTVDVKERPYLLMYEDEIEKVVE